MNTVALHEQGQSIAADTCVGYTVITNQWIGAHQYLSCVAGVGQTLWITCHGGVENYLTNSFSFVAERMSVKLRSVAENQFCLSHHHLLLFLLFVIYVVYEGLIAESRTAGGGVATCEIPVTWMVRTSLV